VQETESLYYGDTAVSARLGLAADAAVAIYLIAVLAFAIYAGTDFEI